MRQLDPQLFPRDAPIIDAQARLTFMDETVAAVARLTTTRLPALFLGLYLASLALLAVAVASIGRRLYRNRWTVVALLAALTLRHAIPKSGTNTLEGYFHPRQLAFAFGSIAIAEFLRGRPLGVLLALAAAGSLHPTTTLWFAIWVAVASFVSEPRFRRPLIIAAVALPLVVWAAAALGPLAGRLSLMDAEWMAAIAEKEYLFPLQWPLAAWIVNLGYVPLILFVHRRRTAAGMLAPRETALVAGCVSLAVVFLVAVVLNAAQVALAIQLQLPRVFWMLDLLAVVYAIWALAEGPTPSVRRAQIAAAVLVAISIVRGTYVMRVEFPNRPLFEPGVPGDWGRVAAWAGTTPRDSGWLADPMHAVRYGTSLRMAAARDVFVEGTKDSAIGMYDRDIAIRTRDRLRAIPDFTQLSVERARELAAKYELDYMVTEHDVALPLAFQAGSIRVYRLR
jgi:hypothetical protein